MIIKVNNMGILIDVSMSEELTDDFGTTNAVIPRSFIAKFKIKLPHKGKPEMLELEDLDREPYHIHFSLITSINGQTGFTSNLEVFNEISNHLFGFE